MIRSLVCLKQQIINCEEEEAGIVDKIMLQETIVWDVNRIPTVIRTILKRHIIVKQ
jgi:hypothetical protein